MKVLGKDTLALSKELRGSKGCRGVAVVGLANLKHNE